MKNRKTIASSRMRPNRSGQLAVEVHDADHQHRLAGAGVELHLGAALKQDQRLAHRLQQVVRGQAAGKPRASSARRSPTSSGWTRLNAPEGSRESDDGSTRSRSSPHRDGRDHSAHADTSSQEPCPARGFR